MERKRSNVEMAALDTASGSRKWKRSSAPPDADAAIRGQMQHDPGMDDFADRDRDHRDRGDRDRENCNVREQDRFMPIANVIRIMRKVLPMHAKISDDGKETIQECVSEFISFVTSEANDRCQREQRKTITAEDLLWAMSKLGFDDYIDPLTFYLHRYREVEGDHRGSVRGDSLPKKEMNLHGLQPMMVQPNMFGGLSYYKDESNAPFTHDSYTVHK